MNILLTGKNGFIGSELDMFLSENSDYKTYSTCRQSLDVTSKQQVDAFFKEHHIDVVVHTAIKGGRRTRTDTFQDFMDNLNMFANLQAHSDKFKFMISFGSGAENRLDTYYGMVKHIINEQIKLNDKLVNLKLYGCFGPREGAGGFIKSSYRRLLKNEDIVIHQNKYMDFFYIEDVKQVVDYYIKNYQSHDLPQIMDMCYKDKRTLLEIAYKIKNLTNSNVGIIIDNERAAPSYAGNSTRLDALPLKLSGFNAGLQQTLKVMDNAN